MKNTNRFAFLHHPKWIASISVVLGAFTISAIAFNGPPVGCTPESCTKPLTQNFSTQRVGIAQSNPQTTLDVNGEVKLGNNSVVCNGTIEGSMRYNSTENDLEMCDGTDWIIAGDGGSPTFSCGNTVSYEGQDYATVEIGSQCWFAENLNVGTMVNGTTEMSDNSTIEKYCYDNNTSNCDTYGALYQWDELMAYTTTEGTQGICPSGWHVPSDAEWHTLENYLATGTCSSTRTAWECDPAGSALNSGGSSGFNALLAGARYTNGSFSDQGFNDYFWSSSESGSNAWIRHLNSSNSTVYRYPNGQAVGFSARCLRD